MEFSSTRVVNNWQKKSKECETCKSIEVLAHQACNSNCLGDTKREQHLIAQKINQKLKTPIDIILAQKFDFKHPDLNLRISALESEINQFKNQISIIPAIWKEFSGISDKLPKRALKESKIVNFEQRIKNLDETLNRLEFDLSTKAAEHYDNCDLASGIPENESESVDKSKLNVYFDELQRQTGELDEFRNLNNLHTDLLQNMTGINPEFEKTIFEFKQEFDESKKRADLLDSQLKKIEEMQKSLQGKIQGQYLMLNEIRQKGDTMKRKQMSIKMIRPAELIKVTENIFKGRSHLKQYQEFTKTSLVSHLRIFKNIPALQSQINSFSAEISRYQ